MFTCFVHLQGQYLYIVCIFVGKKKLIIAVRGSVCFNLRGIYAGMLLNCFAVSQFILHRHNT